MQLSRPRTHNTDMACHCAIVEMCVIAQIHLCPSASECTCTCCDKAALSVFAQLAIVYLFRSECVNVEAVSINRSKRRVYYLMMSGSCLIQLAKQTKLASPLRQEGNFAIVWFGGKRVVGSARNF